MQQPTMIGDVARPAGDKGRWRIGAGLRAASLAVASLRLTLAIIALLLAAVIWIYDASGEANATEILAWPLGLLALNLLAAIATNQAFRRQMPLLLFHLALLAIVLLAAIGRLTYLRATAEVTVGAELEALDNLEAGPWHRGARERLRFENLGFSIDYKPGLRRDRTRNRVRWRDEANIPHEAEIGDQVPLVIDGYRIYTTPNKGFAAIFEWHGENGVVQAGSVNFPAYPVHANRQVSNWVLGGREFEARLLIDQSPLDPAAATRFDLPQRYRLVVRSSLGEFQPRPGESVPLGRGRLVFRGLGSWMGYSVFYDWTIPWLLAASSLAVVALAWHFRRKFAARPWTAG